jgi:hypothetical protein
LSTASNLAAYVSVYNTKVLVKSGKTKIGALHKALFSISKAFYAPLFYPKLFFHGKSVSGLLMIPNPIVNFL